MNNNWDNNNIINSSLDKSDQSPPRGMNINMKVINYDTSKGAGSKNKKSKFDIFDDKTWAHNGLKENFDLEGSIDLDDF